METRLKVSGCILAVVISSLCAANSAQAITISSSRGTSSNNDVLIMGATIHDGDARLWICVDYFSGGSHHTTWTEVSNPSSQVLNDDVYIYMGAGADNVTIVSDNLYGGSGYYRVTCGTEQNDWYAFSDNGYLVNVHGDTGGDTMTADENETRLWGEDDNDSLLTYNTFPAKGGDGGDDVVSWSGGSSDTLYGQVGDDCLEDDTASASVFDAGTGDDYCAWDPPNYPAGSNCEHSTAACF
jgi:hypothetical protein